MRVEQGRARWRQTASRPDSGRAWWALIVVTLVAGLSAPGQTIGVSVFIDPMLGSLPVTRSQLSGAYLVGTLTGAMALPLVGTWADRVGVRRALIVITFGFAGALAAMSSVAGPITLALGFTVLRLCGQGANGVVTGASVAVWFERRRGLAVGLLTTGGGLLLASIPMLLERSIAAVGWRTTWLLAAVGIAVVLLPLLVWTLANQPPPRSPDSAEPVTGMPREAATPPASSHDAAAPTDGTAAAPGPAPTSAGRDAKVRSDPRRWSLDRRQAMRTVPFWGLAAVSAAVSLLGTGVTFHHIAIMAERGLTGIEATAVFLPLMVGGAIAALTAGALTDRVPGRLMLAGTMVALTAGLITGSYVQPGLLAAAYGLCIGAAQASSRTVVTALLPAWFGTRHIASIHGALMTVGIGASALGPLLVSWLEPLTFTAGLRLLAIPSGILIVLALFLGPPRRVSAPRPTA